MSLDPALAALPAVCAWVILLGCASAPPFRCSEDAACDLKPGGVCERSGACSYPDADCASGRRYHEDSAASRAGDCVGARRDLIDDFEDGDLRLLETNGRQGAFVAYADATGGTHVCEVVTLESPRSDAGRALHIVARGFTDWGVTVASEFVVTASGPVPFDASSTTGLGFFARSAEEEMSFQLMVRTPLTWDPEICTKCKDHHATTILLDPEWRWFYVPFTDLRQGGWGAPQGPLELTEVLGTDFKIQPPNDAEFWLDDLALVTD